MLTPNGFRKKLEELMDKVANGEDASEVLDTLITSHDSITNRTDRDFGEADEWDETALFTGDDFKEKYESLKATYKQRFFSGKDKESPEELPPDGPTVKDEHLSDIIYDFRK